MIGHYSDCGAANGEQLQDEEPQDRGEGDERVEAHGGVPEPGGDEDHHHHRRDIYRTQGRTRLCDLTG